MRIQLIWVGKTSRIEISQLIQYYETRLPKIWNFEISEVPDIKNAASMPIEKLKIEEGKSVMQKIPKNHLIISLDEHGKEYTSLTFSQFIESKFQESIPGISFIIGGAWGFSDQVKGICSHSISLSKMTFTHQMVRLFFIEQLYRAAQIQQGKPYHNP